MNPLVLLPAAAVAWRGRRSGVAILVVFALLPLLRPLLVESDNPLRFLQYHWYPIHLLTVAALGVFLWMRARRRSVSVEELSSSPATSTDLQPDQLAVDEAWARHALAQDTPLWSRLLPPRVRTRTVWDVDMRTADGRRIVRLCSVELPITLGLEGELAAPLSMSAVRLPAHTKVSTASYRDAPRNDIPRIVRIKRRGSESRPITRYAK